MSVVFHQSKAEEQFLLRALAWSLAIHLLCFATWKAGQSRGWWVAAARPRWMHALTKKLLTPVAIKIPPPKQPLQPAPLVFVDTDPAQAVKEQPKNVKYYSANNTLAANPELKKPSDDPNIIGQQTHVLKATDSGKPKAPPLQPSPKPEETTAEQAASKPKARPSVSPGDMAMAKPTEQKQPDDGKAETDPGASADTQPQPAHHRPRTIQEALQQRGMTGERIRQSGGVNIVRADSSFAAMGTSYGEYDREFIEAVQARWDQLLVDHTPSITGRVEVEFRLLPSGRVTDVKVIENTVDDVSASVCYAAITDPAPYRPWPRQMQIDLGADHRDVRFTFYYEPQ